MNIPEKSGSTGPQLFVFGAGTGAGETVQSTGTGTARLHGLPKRRGHKARTTPATQLQSEPSHQHLVPLLVLRYVQDIPTLVAFSVISMHFHDILSHKTGSVLQQQLPTLLASLQCPNASSAATHKRASTWQPPRLWSAATRLKCLKWLCSITDTSIINSPEVAQSLLQLFWTAYDIPAAELVSTLSLAGLQLTPELLLHACQHQYLRGRACRFMVDVVELPGLEGPEGWLYKRFAGASVGQQMPFRDLGGATASEVSAANVFDTHWAAYCCLDILGVAGYAEAQQYLPDLTLTPGMLPVLMSMALCFANHKRGDRMARFLSSFTIKIEEQPSAAQHSAAQSASSSRGSMSSSSSRDSSIGGCSSTLSSCGSNPSTAGASSDNGDFAMATFSGFVAVLMQQCVAAGRDNFLDALCQSPAAALLGPATLTDLLRQVLRSPGLRQRVLPPASPHPMLGSLTALPGASTLGPAEIADLLQEAIVSGVSAEVLLQLPGASSLQADQVLELLSAAVHANNQVFGRFNATVSVRRVNVIDNLSSTNRRMALALELGRFASNLPRDSAALVRLLKAAMDSPTPYSVLSGSCCLEGNASKAFHKTLVGLSDLGLLAWLQQNDVLQLLRHCAEKQSVWAWSSLTIFLFPRRPIDLYTMLSNTSQGRELWVWYRAAVRT